MTEPQYGEPWQFVFQGEDVGYTADNDGNEISTLYEPEARRIVACVNAFRGWHDKLVEAIAESGLGAALEKSYPKPSDPLAAAFLESEMKKDSRRVAHCIAALRNIPDEIVERWAKEGAPVINDGQVSAEYAAVKAQDPLQHITFGTKEPTP